MVRYGTLDSNGRPVYAGTTLVVDGVPYANAKREMWLAQGKKPFLGSGANPPKSKREGWHYERDGWREQANAIVPKWKLVQDPPPSVRVFDKYKLVDALMKAGVWDDVKQWLQSVPDAYDRAVMAPDISEDEPLLKDGIEVVKEMLGWTDKQVKDVLSESEI